MKTSEIIKELQKIVDREGDKEFHVYKSFSKENAGNLDIFYDDAQKDICIGIYA